MKRSEMIKVMEANGYGYDMEEVLCAMEEAGMLPPRNTNATFEQQLEKGLHFWEE